jgi:hypothetical protein
MRKAALQLVAALFSTGLAVFSAAQMVDHVRRVDILLLFAGGFAAGVTLVTAIRALRG